MKPRRKRALGHGPNEGEREKGGRDRDWKGRRRKGESEGWRKLGERWNQTRRGGGERWCGVKKKKKRKKITVLRNEISRGTCG